MVIKNADGSLFVGEVINNKADKKDDFMNAPVIDEAPEEIFEPEEEKPKKAGRPKKS